MDRTFEIRGLAETMQYLSETERHAAQNFCESILDGHWQKSPPRSRLFPHFLKRN